MLSVCEMIDVSEPGNNVSGSSNDAGSIGNGCPTVDVLPLIEYVEDVALLLLVTY